MEPHLGKRAPLQVISYEFREILATAFLNNPWK